VGKDTSSNNDADWIIQIPTGASGNTLMLLFRCLSGHKNGSEQKLVVCSDVGEITNVLRKTCGMERIFSG
jgi:hypothetical protein